MQKKLTLSALGILFIASVAFFYGTIRPAAPPVQPTVLSLDTTKFSVKQIVNYSTSRQEQSTHETESGRSVLDILSSSKNITVQETSLGKLVQSIEGVTNGMQNKYWMYFVNGKEASVGAAELLVQPDDTIEWKFQSYEQ